MIVVVGGLLGLIVIVAIAGLIHGLQLEHRLKTLPATLQSVTTEAESGKLAEAQGNLARAERTLTSVNSALYNDLDFEVLNVLPVARQNLHAIRAGVQLGLQMVGGGEEVLQAASPLETSGQLSVPLQQGQLPLQTVEAVQSAVENVAGMLPDAPSPPGGSLLLSPVRSAVGKVYQEARKRQAELQSVAAGLRLAEDISGARGDKRYLIAVANSAEMRGSGGMILSYGVLTSHAGKVTLVNVGPIDEISLTSPESAVSFPADFMKTYGGFAPTADWRNVNMMSDFTVDAPVMAAMYEHTTGQHADGVIQTDSAGLAAILAGVGPVATRMLGTVTAGNAVALTLSTAYALYPGRASRQDYTGDLAQAAFQKLTTGRFTSLKPLGTALVDASKQRHVLMYVGDPTDETAIRILGFDGALPTPGAGVTQLTVQNFGANKLDYYLESTITLGGRKPTVTGSVMTATIDLVNTAPAGRVVPQEVFGPFLPGEIAGEYYGLVTLYVPPGSFLKGSTPDVSLTTDPTMASQNGLSTVSYTVAIPAGSASHVALQIYVPPTPAGLRQLRFIPAPRVIPTRFVDRLS